MKFMLKKVMGAYVCQLTFHPERLPFSKALELNHEAWLIDPERNGVPLASSAADHA